MATILVKNLPEELLKELKRLKVELGCKTWADLLSELVITNQETLIEEEKKSKTETGVQNFLNLKTAVSTKWNNGPTVIEETRRSRRHESAK
ncbi:MAG: hypothetical protein ACLQO7_02290 [Candidatus Bathyarchaeia archaeon]